jgi:hypothetical protein
VTFVPITIKQPAALEGANSIRDVDEGRGAVTFENIYFGYTGDGVTATESYPGVPPWWSLPLLPAKVRAEDMEVDSRGFAVPWAMYIDGEHRFWLNGNYSVYSEPSEKACMEVARTADGYFVGLSGCQGRTWSPEGEYSDPFVALPVSNLHAV